MATPRSERPRGNDIPTCEACSQRHVDRHGLQACTGHVYTDRDTYQPGQPRAPLEQPLPCRNSPMSGQEICQKHGGTAAHNRAAGERRVTEQQAAKVLRRFGEPVDTTPTDALLDAVKWTAGYVNWLREKVGPAGGDSLTDEAALTEFSKATGKREANAWVELLGQWHDRLERICMNAIKAGIEERRVRIAEQQGALVADVIRKILGDLNLSPEQAAKAGETVPRHLRSLAS